MMNKNFNNSIENRNFVAQKKRVLKALSKHPSTMLMLSVETGILRANICRYFQEWKQQDKVVAVEKKPCKISKHDAVYYSLVQALFYND